MNKHKPALYKPSYFFDGSVFHLGLAWEVCLWYTFYLPKSFQLLLAITTNAPTQSRINQPHSDSQTADVACSSLVTDLLNPFDRGQVLIRGFTLLQ